MFYSISDWLFFLRTSESLIGLPLLVGGMALMLFGWRMWRLCVVLSFGLLGGALSAHYFPATDGQGWYVLGGGVVMGLLSYYPARYSLALLGGLIAAGLMMHLVSELRLPDPVVWLLAIVALLGGVGYALINRRLVVIIVTSTLGAVLLMSGLITLIMLSPPLYGTLESMASGSVIVVPFVLLVPTVMSCFFQIAEVNRLQAEP